MARLYIVLAAFVAVAAVSVLAGDDCSSAEGDDWSDGLQYEIDNGVLSITPVDDGKQHSYTMKDFEPGTQPWCSGEQKFVDVYIRANNIGSYAFYGLRNVVVVSMDNLGDIKVKEVGSYQFAGTGLISFDTQTVEKLGQYALANCNSLSDVTVSEHLKFDADTFPTVFVGDASIIHFHVSENNQDFSGDGTPSGSKQIMSKNNTVFYRYATGNTDGDQRGYSYNIPFTVTEIYKYAFESSSYIVAIDFTNTQVKSIGDRAFQNCRYLGAIAISNTITTIGTSVFADSKALQLIQVSKDSKYFDNDDYGALYGLDSTGKKVKLICCPPERTLKDGKFVVPDTVTEICTDAFSSNSSLESILLPSGLKSIGQNAFEYCKISSIEIPESVEYIGDHAFIMCEQLRYAIIHGGDTIGAGIFVHCTGLTRVFDYTGNYVDLLSTPVHVIYKLQPGASILDRGFVSGSSLTLPTVDEPDGYFAMWDCSSHICLNGETISLSRTMVVKHTYEVGHTVTFDSAGGSSVSSQLVPSGYPADEPSDPTKDGYVFVCWRMPDGKIYDFETAVETDMVLTAEWTAKSSSNSTSWIMVAVFIILGFQVAGGVLRFMNGGNQ